MKSLPNIDVLPVHSLKLEVLKKDITFSPFTVEQEKGIFIALENDNTTDIIRNYQNVIQSCVKEDIDWENLSVVDFVTLAIHIRAKSKGEDLHLRKDKCEKCEKPYDVSVQLEESLNYKNTEKFKDIIQINENLSLELKPLNYNFLYGLDELKNEIDIYIHTAAHSISKVVYNNEIFIVSDVEELKEKIIKHLTIKNLSDIFKKCNNLINLYLVVDFICPFCQHTERLEVNGFLKSLK